MNDVAVCEAGLVRSAPHSDGSYPCSLTWLIPSVHHLQIRPSDAMLIIQLNANANMSTSTRTSTAIQMYI
jgi:hypothetical protein